MRKFEFGLGGFKGCGSLSFRRHRGLGKFKVRSSSMLIQ